MLVNISFGDLIVCKKLHTGNICKIQFLIFCLVFYEVVMEKCNDDAYLITGNIKHFPERKYIVTPAQMMSILDEKSKE